MYTLVSKTIYVIGSLRNPNIPKIGAKLRALGFDAFDDWHAAGPTADDSWKEYETQRGHSYAEALQGYAAKHVFDFDLRHLTRCDMGLLVLPAGRSGHLELGYLIGTGKPGYILHDNPERYDVMYRFAEGVFFNEEELYSELSAKYLSQGVPSGADEGHTKFQFPHVLQGGSSLSF